MRQTDSAMPASIDPPGPADEVVVVVIDEPNRLMRGVKYGLILVLPIWLAIGYTMFILR